MLIKILSLFSGAGGLDLGFKLAEEGRYKTIWAIDSDKDATSTFELNFGKDIIKNQDITLVDPFSNIVPDCDLIIGGFPCQDFSIIGTRHGIDSQRGNLFQYFVNFVSAKRPKAFVAENVQGLVSANHGQALKNVIESFENVGYNVSWQIYNFADYGVPQFRKRVLFVGIRNDIGVIFDHPKPTHGPKEAKRWISAKDALFGVEFVPYNNEKIACTKKVEERLNLIPSGANYSSIAPTHPLYVKGRRSCIYRRLDPNQPSYTLLANGGGGTWGYHWSEPRALTNRERARLQTFPDDFIFIGSISSVRRQIGNAVPPWGVVPLAKKLLSIFKE